MKYLIIILLFACSQPTGKIILGKDSVGETAPNRVFVEDQNAVVFYSLGAYYCCDTIRTLNNTAIVKSVLDTAGNLTGFEIVKVLN